jgi:hypothetical protein
MEDKDLGMKKILAEMKKLGSMTAKVGFPDNGDEKNGVKIAQYAFWNENGVAYGKGIIKNKSPWFIPPRPFMAQAADNNQDKIIKAAQKLVADVADGKIDAQTAMLRQAENMVSLIKKTIRDGNFKANSEITLHGIKNKSGKVWIKGKKSTKPLINNGTMRGAVAYQTFEDGSKTAEGKGKKS